MKKYFEILKNCSLLNEISENDFELMFNCLEATITEYEKNEVIISEDEKVTSLGIVLSGKAQIIKEDYYGNRNIITTVSPAQLFAEAFACTEVDSIPVSVIAAEKCNVMMIDCRRILEPCHNGCVFHNKLIHNLLFVVAQKNIVLSQKLELITAKSTKDKVISYLLSQAKLNNNNEFTIPYDRQQLADYLCVERSALSARLCELRDEGKLTFHKNHFELTIK